MKSLKLLAAASALALVGFAASAEAATYAWQFTDFSLEESGPSAPGSFAPSNLLASGRLTTANTLNTAGGYDILSINGTVEGYGAITGLVANPNQPNAFSNGVFIYDNVLFLPAPHVSNPGILFTTAGNSWNIYRNGGVDNLTGHDGVNYIPDINGVNGSFAVQAVPEPASWAMMIAGFGLAGAAMRRRTAKAVLA